MIKRCHLSVLIASVLMSTVAFAAAEPGSSEDLGISDRQYFMVYPHLEKAMRALKEGRESVAISEFERAQKQAPESARLALYLSEAYRHFGHDDQAKAVLDRQLKRTPSSASGYIELKAALAAVPGKTWTINTLADLKRYQADCDSAPTIYCRSDVGQHALRLGQLDIAKAQLNDAKFNATPEGHTLADAIMQRAIFLKKWDDVDDSFERLRTQGKLTYEQSNQWFGILLAQHSDDKLVALQGINVMNAPLQQLHYAQSLALRNENARLSTYLQTRTPRFVQQDQERGWLYLLAKYSQNPSEALSSYPIDFAENKTYIAQTLIPDRIAQHDLAGAKRLLAGYSRDQLLEQRLQLSEAENDTAQIVQLARQMYQRSPQDLTLLDRLSYQLVKTGQKAEASRLLLARYPYQNAGATGQNLTSRLMILLKEDPRLLTAKDIERLSVPLPTPQQRMQQASVFNTEEQCPIVRRLLGDMSPDYGATAWYQLANCYRTDSPGLALFAYQQADRRQSNTFSKRSLAYQAYAVQDFQAATRAWSAVPVADMSAEDTMAAANSALAAHDIRALTGWLSEAKKHQQDKTAEYWWLHSHSQNDPSGALADLNRSIEIKPMASALADRAALYRQQNQLNLALADLHQAIAIEPDNTADHAALGYALWDADQIALSRDELKLAEQHTPDDPALIQQLAYVNQRLDDIPQAQSYTERVVDDIDRGYAPQGLSEQDAERRFNFRRMHEDTGRRWTFSVDMSMGLSGKNSIPNSSVLGSSTQPYAARRSYGQMEAEYRVGHNQIVDGDLLSVYSRVFAGSGSEGNFLPTKAPMMGLGVRWKPLREQVFYLAAEQQIPLDRHESEADMLLRASASFLNGGKYSDEWHPNGNGWIAQNLYLDAAHYVKQDSQSYTADYRLSWHQKIPNIPSAQTLEPYGHLQYNATQNGAYSDAKLGGIGVRWNMWSGENHYDAYPHKISVGIEFQHLFSGKNQFVESKNGAFVTFGGRW
uniref:NfrA family protein n=1 Tax=Hafnia alvei TaxID=569 RepID=UPI0026EE432C|nr:tetratricopeptide repeat protein [Hafnia alvei]